MTAIKDKRIELGLTQQQLSDITGVPFRTIQNWEGGQRKCPDYVEKMILDKLNQMFDQPDYKTILEEILDMLKSDMKMLHNSYTEHYVQNVIDEIEDSLK